MNIDPKELARGLRRQGHDVTDARVAELLSQVDTEAVKAKHRARIVHSKWDRKSPINGCSPDVILAQPNHDQPGHLYTLAIDGQVTVIQPFKPGVPGFQPMSDTDWETEALAHANAIAESQAGAEIHAAVVAGL